ncbi:MAG: hypothetical protein ACLTK0_05245 [Anaerovoracaceae bacterium]
MKAAQEAGIDLRRYLEGHACYEALTAMMDCLREIQAQICDFNVLYVGEKNGK